MSKPFEYLVFIGRFQPFHNGHKAVVDKALEMADKVIVLVGSSNQAPSVRNPFSFEQRNMMILKSYPASERLYIRPIDDHTYDDTGWIEQVQSVVSEVVVNSAEGNTEHHHARGMADINVGLIGCRKDDTSYYLSLFPQFGSVDVDQVDPEKMLNATDIREAIYQGYYATLFKDHVPACVMEQLWTAYHTASFQKLITEYEWARDYLKTAHNFPRIEHTVDCVVVCSGHVLLIRRGQQPGKGMLALPGGFVDPKERLQTAALRELKEETCIDTGGLDLAQCIAATETFDDPYRSTRGRVITTAYLINLGNLPVLFPVTGSDDAEEALWMPIAELRAAQMHDDHYFIIQALIKRIT